MTCMEDCMSKAELIKSLNDAEISMADAIQWSRDYHAALKQSASDRRPILADFSAAPM